MRTWTLAAVVVLAAATGLVVAPTARADNRVTFVTSGNLAGPGSLLEAIETANADPRLSKISCVGCCIRLRPWLQSN